MWWRWTGSTATYQITSTKHGIPGTEVELDPAIETGSGLNKVCYACCFNVTTTDQLLVLRTVGVLSAQAMRQIEQCLKTVLGIP